MQSRCSGAFALRGGDVPRGACVIPYNGKRGRVWRIKYADTDGKQVMKTIGAEREGITCKTAEAKLRDRLVRVEKGRWRRPTPLTFAEASATWAAESEGEK